MPSYKIAIKRTETIVRVAEMTIEAADLPAAEQIGRNIANFSGPVIDWTTPEGPAKFGGSVTTYDLDSVTREGK